MLESVLILVGFTALGLVLWLTYQRSRQRADKNLIVGGIYSINGGDGKFGIAKILKVEPGIVHVCIYKNKYAARPISIKIGDLSVGKITDKDGYGIGHLPINTNAFSAWKAVLMMKAEVNADDLAGYKIWKASGGGVF